MSDDVDVVVVGLGPTYVRNTLNGGSGGWGAVFSAIFIGLAAGMFLGLVAAGYRAIDSLRLFTRSPTR